MEMYGGKPPKYHMRGMLNSPRISECIDNFANHLFRAIAAVEAISYRTGRKDIAALAVKLKGELAEKTGCLDEEGIQNLKRKAANNS